MITVSIRKNEVIAISGIFPNPSSGGPYTEQILGEVRMFAGSFAPYGWAFRNGQLLSISQNSNSRLQSINSAYSRGRSFTFSRTLLLSSTGLSGSKEVFP